MKQQMGLKSPSDPVILSLRAKGPESISGLFCRMADTQSTGSEALLL